MNVEVSNEDMVHLVELLKNSQTVMFRMDKDLICKDGFFKDHVRKNQKSLDYLKKSGGVNVMVMPTTDDLVDIYVDVVDITEEMGETYD